MGPDIIFPAAGFIAMAIEGIHQITEALSSKDKATIFTNKGFRLRNSTFPRAMVLEEGKKLTVMLTMARAPGVGNPWHDFRVRSKVADVWNEHCKGSIRVEEIWGKSTYAPLLADYLLLTCSQRPHPSNLHLFSTPRRARHGTRPSTKLAMASVCFNTAEHYTRPRIDNLFPTCRSVFPESHPNRMYIRTTPHPINSRSNCS